MRMPVLEQLHDVRGKRVLVRADFNVPITDGLVGDEEDWRIRKTLPTIEWLKKRGAKVIIASHLGRPEGKKVASLSLAPVAKRLSQLLRMPVLLTSEPIGAKAAAAVESMNDGDVVLLENLRFKPGEEKDDPKFAKALAEMADIYVNDAFAVCHRKAASVSAITKLLPSYAGMLLEKEIRVLSAVLKQPIRPMLVMMGGAKVSSKIGVIKRLLEVADRVMIGGALANPFFKALGFGIGASLTSPEDEEAAQKLLKSALAGKLILPHDLVIGDSKKPATSKAEVVDISVIPRELCGPKQAIYDVGPKTISAYSSYLRSANMIVWNGPLGLFEIPKFSHGTLALGRLIASRSKGRTFGVVGGGESVMALSRTGLMECVDHVSTGGGAMLEFLEGKSLPGIEALKK